MALLKEKTYGLVLSDWNMQPVTGLELLKQVRAEERTKKTPFVMVTAEAKVENVIAARQAGVNNYVIKPFTLAVLKQKLTSVVGEI
jgi:two-component system chemotaxis response regulator CheY